MTVFDRRIPIYETTDERLLPIENYLPTLDKMLNQYVVAHAFALPTTKETAEYKAAKGKSLACWLLYGEEANTVMTLVLSLFCKLHLKRDDGTILETIMRSMSKTIPEISVTVAVSADTIPQLLEVRGIMSARW